MSNIHLAAQLILITHLVFSDAQGDGLFDALTLGTNVSTGRDECVWRRGNDKDPCPDPNVHYYLYSPRNGINHVAEVDHRSRSWLRESNYDPNKDTVVLVHGYAGISDVLPMGVLRDAYLTNGSFNVFVVDWSPLAKIPCYASAVHNMKPVSRCLSTFLTFLRDSGVDFSRTTCVGHSLGAHICGITTNYLLFRLHKIIGLDPARPLIRSQLKGRLDPGDAQFVQVIHTSSTFGDARRSGHVDFCVNGARIQPFCVNATNEALCSHIRSVCYLAESLNPAKIKVGAPCVRRCLTGGPRPPVWENRGMPVPMGHFTPEWADGMFCVNSDQAPYCPTERSPVGNHLCCVPPKPHVNTNLVK